MSLKGWLYTIPLRWRALFRRAQADQELDEELRFHLEEKTAEYVAKGLEPGEARRRAVLDMDGVERSKEECREMRKVNWIHDLIQDLRYGARVLAKSPGFTTVAVLTLALGIGANTAIFSVVNAVLLRPLPVKEPESLVQIARLLSDGQPVGVSQPLFENLRDHVQSISGAFAHWSTNLAIAIDGEEEFVTADFVTGEYYLTLGLDPIAGRLLTPADDLATATPAAVISERYWERRFGRSPAAIGTLVQIRDRAFTIVGVTPASFQSVQPGHAAEITLPQARLMAEVVSEKWRRDPTAYWLSLVARLKPGATLDQANAEVQVLWRAFLHTVAAAVPEKERDEVLSARARVLPAADGVNPLRYSHQRPLLILMGIVTMVLLLACVNLSGLLLARAAARQREISIRLAIGAGRERLVRQLLTESLPLAAAGGALGLVVATWFSARLVAMFTNDSMVLTAAPDGRVLAFTAAVSLVACLLSSLAPAVQAARTQVNPALKEVRAYGSRRLGQGLVVAQLAISMVLIVGATLFVGTLAKLYAVDRGFDSNGVLIVTLRSGRLYSAERGKAVKNALIERLRAEPGIRAASATQILPISGSLRTKTIQVEGYVFRSDEADSAGFNVVGPGYFAALGTPLVSGREFDDRDDEKSPKVAIVNETFARYFFGAGSALGRRVTITSIGVTYEIVGVVRDTKYRNLRDPVVKTVYIPWMQAGADQPSQYAFLARAATGEPLRFAPLVQQLVRDVDPALHVRATFSYATLIDRSLVTERILATLGGAFGLLALIVASLGVFGVLAFQVARRTNELGVRMALGATRWAITRLVLRQVAWIVLPGIAIGGGGALLVTGLARNILFDLTPTEPRVFLLAALVLTMAAALAGWLPARRAARIDPMQALRHE